MPNAGTAFSADINPQELRDLRATLRAMKPDSPEYLDRFKAANKRAGEIIAAAATRNLQTMGGEQAAAANRVRGVNSGTDIKVAVSNTSSVPFALAAVWGMKRRTGWYSAGRYQQGGGRVRRAARRLTGRQNGQQHRPWVGNTWDVGAAGTGPYGLNDAIASHLDDAVDGWGDAIEQLMNDVRGR